KIRAAAWCGVGHLHATRNTPDPFRIGGQTRTIVPVDAIPRHLRDRSAVSRYICEHEAIAGRGYTRRALCYVTKECLVSSVIAGLRYLKTTNVDVRTTEIFLTTTSILLAMLCLIFSPLPCSFEIPRNVIALGDVTYEGVEP